MRLYSDTPGRRTVQILWDVSAVAVLALGITLAVIVHNAIASLDVVGQRIQQSGVDLSDTMTDIGDKLAALPVIGGTIGDPFDTASGAGGTLADAGIAWQNGVHSLAALVAWTIVVFVVALAVFGWVLPRLLGASKRTATANLASADLLALRALVSRPPKVLARIDPDAVGAWRRGDPDVTRKLADLELSRAGIRLNRP